MELWTLFVELLRAAPLRACRAARGRCRTMPSSVMSVGVRLALLPMTFRLAIRAQEIQRKIRDLAPELEDVSNAATGLIRFALLARHRRCIESTVGSPFFQNATRYPPTHAGPHSARAFVKRSCRAWLAEGDSSGSLISRDPISSSRSSPRGWVGWRDSWLRQARPSTRREALQFCWAW